MYISVAIHQGNDTAKQYSTLIPFKCMRYSAKNKNGNKNRKTKSLYEHYKQGCQLLDSSCREYNYSFHLELKTT